MKDVTDRPQNELDVLKFYVWLMLAMTGVLGVLIWLMWSDVKATERTVAQGRQSLRDFAAMKHEIQAMLNVYRTNKEDIARDQPYTWFSSIWRRKGIPDQSISPSAWKTPPVYRAKGNYYEEQIDLKFNQKDPLAREQIAAFCHEVERSSTRQRLIELNLKRADRDNPEADKWYGSVQVGYRVPKVAD